MVAVGKETQNYYLYMFCDENFSKGFRNKQSDLN